MKVRSTRPLVIATVCLLGTGSVVSVWGRGGAAGSGHGAQTPMSRRIVAPQPAFRHIISKTDLWFQRLVQPQNRPPFGIAPHEPFIATTQLLHRQPFATTQLPLRPSIGTTPLPHVPAVAAAQLETVSPLDQHDITMFDPMPRRRAFNLLSGFNHSPCLPIPNGYHCDGAQ